MEVIWVIENVKRSKDFYTKQFTLLLAASVCLWKRYHPNHKTVLYADDITSNFYKETPLLGLFDEIRPLSYSNKIDREVFFTKNSDYMKIGFFFPKRQLPSTIDINRMNGNGWKIFIADTDTYYERIQTGICK